jgi:hypothetical protein
VTHGAQPSVELLRVDPRLEALTASLFWTTFPQRSLGKAAHDGDGRVPLLVDTALDDREGERWRRALDALLLERAGAGAFLRDVHDRESRRIELALPVAPAAYAGGAWLVGPFPSDAAADAWAARRLERPWVHDVVDHAGARYADVFRGDGDAPRAGSPEGTG